MVWSQHWPRLFVDIFSLKLPIIRYQKPKFLFLRIFKKIKTWQKYVSTWFPIKFNTAWLLQTAALFKASITYQSNSKQALFWHQESRINSVTTMKKKAKTIDEGDIGGYPEYRNTVRKNDKYRNTTSKIIQIPIPHILITFIISPAYLWLLRSSVFNYLRHLLSNSWKRKNKKQPNQNPFHARLVRVLISVACSVGVFWPGKSCLFMFVLLLNRHLCYDGGRLGRVKMVILRTGAGAKEGKRGGPFSPLFSSFNMHFREQNIQAPEENACTSGYDKRV